jgi:hypothetical protein
VTIDTATFDTFGIVAHYVADLPASQISVPEDDEIILVYRDGQEFPRDVIVTVTKL